MHDKTIFCENCCHCNYGKGIKCPLYKGNLENTSITDIKKSKRKREDFRLYLAICFLFGHRIEKNERKAISILYKLSRKNNTPAKYLLSYCYFNGIAVSKNEELAFTMCYDAGMKGCNLAEIRLYECYKDGIGVAQDFQKAKEWCEHAAYHKSKEMYIDFAKMCSSTVYGKPNLKKACEFYELSYADGNEDAYKELVELHKRDLLGCFGSYRPESKWESSEYINFGDFCASNKYAPDIAKAFVYYKKAIKMLHKELKQYQSFESSKLSSLYKLPQQFNLSGQKERELNNTIQKAKDCFEKYFTRQTKSEVEKSLYSSALNGDASAQFEFAELFTKSDFSMHSFEEAVYWYTLSAEQGNMQAQYKLGSCYYKGEGVEKDCNIAINWYKSSAIQGNLDAQLQLGICYFKGDGVEQDYNEATRLFRTVALNGNETAEYYMGECYFFGTGVPQDYNEALSWYDLASKKGNKDSLNRINEIQNILNPKPTPIFTSSHYDFSYSSEPQPTYVEPTPPYREETIYYDWRTGERLYYDENRNIVNSNGEEVSAAFWD